MTTVAKRRGAARIAFWGFGQYDQRRGERGSPNGRATGPFGPAPGRPAGGRTPGADRRYDVEGTGHEVVDEPGRQLPERDDER